MRKKTGLKIVIVGCGKIGRTLVEQLSNEGHDIIIIDTDASKVQNINNLYDVIGIAGNGASLAVQDEAGVSTSDLLIAVTGSDELNLLCCIIAKQSGHCSTIARIRTPEYINERNYLRDKLGLAMIINPDYEAAKQISQILYLPTALEVNSFAHGEAEMIKFKIPDRSILDDMSIANLGSNITNDILICAVERNNEITIPSGSYILKSGDTVSFVSTRKSAEFFLNRIGFNTKQVHNTLIIGGGRSAYYLANELVHNGVRVKIIEKDRNRCEKLSTLLEDAIVINGDGINQDLLKEEGIETCASFVPLTGIDEENIMLTLYAKKVSNAKVITKINRIGFAEVVSGLDLGSVIYPKYITAEAIIAYVRAKTNSIGSNVETLYHLFDSRVEAIEFAVSEESELTDVELKNLKLKPNLLIAFISRAGKVIFPSGNDVIKPGDTVMIVTTNSGFTQINDILR